MNDMVSPCAGGLHCFRSYFNSNMLIHPARRQLSSGDIPNLFPNEDIDDICNAIRPEVKQAGLIDTRDACWEFYIEKVRKHVCLCFLHALMQCADALCLCNVLMQCADALC